MKLKMWPMALLALAFAAQWWVPGQMIFRQEMVFEKGTPFKFKTAPIDPSDPFRGKYIWLDFEAAEFEVTGSDRFVYYEQVYVSLGVDSAGYAKVTAVSRTRPTDTEHYMQATVSSENSENNPKIALTFPFDKFYMEESKAYEAEVLHRDAAVDTASVSHALVFVRNGISGLADVFIDDVPIREAVMRNR